MAEFASKGVSGAGLGLGIAGTALGLANGGLNNLLGNLGVGGNSSIINDMAGLSLASSLLGGRSCCGCNETVGATRYDLGIMNQLSQKDAQIARLEVSQETDKKILDLYKYIDGKDKVTGETIAQIAAAQAVQNQKIKAFSPAPESASSVHRFRHSFPACEAADSADSP